MSRSIGKVNALPQVFAYKYICVLWLMGLKRLANFLRKNVLTTFLGTGFRVR